MPRNGLRVLGIDPGLSRCGVAVVEGPPHRPRVRRAGVVRTAPGDPVAARLVALHVDLEAVVREERPDAVAVERVFFNANVRTAIGVAQAAGVALLVAAQAGLQPVEYTPTQVKSGVCGEGHADKEQVGYVVAARLRLTAPPRPADVADALALALCHLQAVGSSQLAATGTGW